ncbi:MAG: 4Fe-4S dicluster domain-containing protein [Desulfobacteraceae bacterium]|nr:MAG: 4Fe-4S dicluster domain-containing protein [Desulfobacteraceae bacterium]
MSDHYLFQNEKSCIGCQSCEVQCKTNKSLPQGPKPCQVITIGPRFIGNLPRASYIFISCHHCDIPWCVTACPTGAMRKRPEDGIVFIREEDCVGCKTCITACPWGAPQWNPESGKVVKCDYCMDRIDQGLKPACVTICTTQCLNFVPADQIPQVKRELYARFVAESETN